MENSKKLKLQGLKVKSFVTEIIKDHQKTALGGAGIRTTEEITRYCINNASYATCERTC